MLLKAQKYLEIVRKRGEAKAELKRVHRIIRSKELYLMAYKNLYANKGAMTPGVDPEDTVDGMSLKRIDTIIKRLKEGNFKWTPVRRTYRDKPNSRKKRPIGIPVWSNKLLQEVMRMVLEAYYEPQFRRSSHGFRPRRGCHTAIDAIQKWKGTRWFIEGDIKGCFDNLDWEIMLEIIGRKIKDRAFLELLKGMLEAGYMEQWTYHKTYSGTPQGGIISPLLANIVLNELDEYIEDILIPKYTKGKRRQANPEYLKLIQKASRARKKGNLKEANELKRAYTKLPSMMSKDPTFRRLWYVRYADDFILGFIGTKAEARNIKEEIKTILESIKLEMSEEKSLITHARIQKARFLNYEINLVDNTQIIREDKNRCKKRTINGSLYLSVPEDVVRKWQAKVSQGDKIMHKATVMNLSDYDIIRTFEVELQGLINYYTRAHNVYNRMSYLRYCWQEALAKTLAAKHKSSTKEIKRKYIKFYSADGRKLIGVEIPREGKKPLITTFGKKQIQRIKGTVIKDEIQRVYTGRNELITRLLADKCELCGNEGDVEGHHIRKLAELRKRYQGRKGKPEWVTRMIAIRRKTLFVCLECHTKIHNGMYDGTKLT